MYLHEQIAWRMVEERLADAVGAAERPRALRQARPTVRVRLGRTLVRLGHWMAGQQSPALP
jgi:hypothetical protein